MRFGPWYPLHLVPVATPLPDPGPAVVQVRLARGLVDYPTGKSAMVHYAYVDELATGLAQLGQRAWGRPVWWRITEEMTAADRQGLPAYLERILAEFQRRFGAVPGLPT